MTQSCITCTEPFRISSFSLRRIDPHAFAFKSTSQFARELDRARCIAVDTNGFAAHGHVAAFDGAYLAFAQHPQHPLSSFFGVVQQCIRPRTRRQSRETYLSTLQARPQAPPRLSRPSRDQGRPQDSRVPPGAGPQAPVGVRWAGHTRSLPCNDCASARIFFVSATAARRTPRP